MRRLSFSLFFFFFLPFLCSCSSSRLLIFDLVGVNARHESSDEIAGDEREEGFGRYVRSIVFGGMDGIVTTFALCSGGEGAHMSVRVTLILGTSNLFADAVSMAFGDYLSTRAEFSHRQSLWQIVTGAQDMGAARLKRGLQKRGLSHDKAQQVVDLLATSPDALSHAVMAELNVPNAKDTVSWWCFLLLFNVPTCSV